MATVKVSLLAETRQMRAGIDEMNSKLGGFGKTASKLGGALAGAFAGVAIGSALKSVVSAASDAQQSLGATDTVFGKFSKSVIKDSKAAANQFGLDANTYRENANLLGAIFSNQGVAAAKLSGATKQMVGVGADLAATFGGSTTDAVGALSAAFKGEFDSLDKYGISLNATKIAAELAARGQDKLTGSALDAAKQQATADIIMKQSVKTRGAFSKESNTLAGQQARLSAQFTNMKAAIGAKLLPVLTRMVAFVTSKVLPTLAKWGQTFNRDILPVLKDVASTLANTLGPPLRALGDFMANNKAVVATFAGVLGTIVLAVKAWSIAQALLNIVMTANPIGIVVVALAGLAAALVYAYKKSDTFRKIVQLAFKGIKIYVTTYIKVVKAVITTTWAVLKTVTLGTWKFIKDKIIGPFKTAWNFVKTAAKGVKTSITGAWDSAKTKTVAVWDAIKNTVTNKIDSMITKVKGIKGKVLGAFTGAGSWLKETGKNIIEGLWSGLESMGDWLKDKLIDMIKDKLPGPVRKALGINSPSRVFAEIGRYVTQGLAVGIADKSSLSKVSRATAGMTGAIEKGFRSPQAAFAGAGSRGGNTYNITVEAGISDPYATAQTVVGLIDLYESAGGNKRR